MIHDIRQIPPGAVIFDCDGTLVDSEALASEALVGYARELGVALDDAFITRSFRGRKLELFIADMEAHMGRALPEHFLPEFRRRADDLFRERLRPIDGARELVSSLSIPICVASNARREKIKLCLALTGLLPFFEERIFSSYEVGAWKPEPGLFLHAARTMGVEPSRCVVVEDSLPGMLAGVAAGMRVILLAPSDPPEALPEGVHPIRHLSEAAHLLHGGS